MKRKSGISLIVITIAVIVMTTISAVVVVSMKNANHIEYANKVALYSDLKTAKLELLNYISRMELEVPGYDPTNINASGEELIEYMPNLKKEYKNIIQIKEGKMYIIEGTLKYYQIMELREIGIPSIKLEKNYDQLRKDLIAFKKECEEAIKASNNESPHLINYSNKDVIKYIKSLENKPEYIGKIQILNGKFALVEGEFTYEEINAISDLNFLIAPIP